MKKLVLIALCGMTFPALAQKKAKSARTEPENRVTLAASHWDVPAGNAEFTSHDGRPALTILPKPGQVVLKNTSFSSGTIEFDYIPTDQRFASIYFRFKDGKESELFYFRTPRAGDSTSIDAIQYAPITDGVNLWDLLPQYQGGAKFQTKTWNHIKLIISGYQLRVFVNDMQRPAMEVPRMEGNVPEGTIAFEGAGIVSNLVLRPGETAGLPAYEGPDPVAHDPRYLRKWQVSEPVVLPKNVDFSQDYAPKPASVWETIWAERRGMINLTRKFGISKERRVVWMKVNIHSKTDQKKRMAMGFSDDVWVFLNGRYLYVDKNTFGSPIMKEPSGRCSIENTAFTIPLKAGKNELTVAIANDFYGWALIARLEDMDGVEVE